MDRKEVVFVVDSTGDISFTIKGITGPVCREIAERFENLGEVKCRTCKAEFYGETTALSIIRARNGGK